MKTHQDSLSPEKLQLFLAGLAGLPQEEIRKAKSLYIRNAIAEYRALRYKKWGYLVTFAVIPFCWPAFYLMKRDIDWKGDLNAESLEIDGRNIVV